MEYEEKKWDKWISNKKLPSLDNFFEKNKSIFKEYILEPGDILYIPKGFVHKVIPIYKP
jgi:ribosomal protein L16 Arg81 hydroxylase